jgi:hypothetical protein
MTDEDRRALSPLFWAHVNPYGRFVLDMDSRLDLTSQPEPLPEEPRGVPMP